MVVYTMTRKQILRITAVVLAAIVAVLIIVFAITGSVTASAQAEKMPVCSVGRGDNKIALTFNCAWDASDIDTLLDTLGKNDAKATFFVTGEFCGTHPDAVRKMSDGGHSVQNCTDKNIHIKGMNINDLIADAKAASQKIKALTGKEPKLYRAPFGDFDDKTLTTLEGMGLVPVQWSVDSKDLDDPDAVSIKKRVLENTESGSILLFHNESTVNGDTLAQIITGLKQKGFETVRAEELLFSDNYVIDENGVQQYRPMISASLPIIYAENNDALDMAFEKLRQNLTLQEIYDLSSVGRVGMIDKIKSFLNEREEYAVREATYEELMDCYLVLVYAAEHYGCGGTYTEPMYEEIPQITPPEDEEEDIPVIPEDYNDEPDMGKDGKKESDTEKAEIVK
ncbi:MAG: polysaccharide deacetylase family protein [Ruminiclostridium sp.]|nr:polysaccharide deacetylase family protein [Ruminiclostridium sp.]